jgi:hypothetical protein
LSLFCNQYTYWLWAISRQCTFLLQCRQWKTNGKFTHKMTIHLDDQLNLQSTARSLLDQCPLRFPLHKTQDQVEHIRDHLWHRYSISVNQVTVAIVKFSKWGHPIWNICVTNDHGYVLLVITSRSFLNSWLHHWFCN